MYSIKAIASLTGLGTETLRAWERRYQAIVPNRDDNGRRFYSQQDLDRLTLLANLTREGHAISKVSGLKLEELQQLNHQGQEKNEGQQAFSELITEALMDYRIDRCEQLLKRALMANEPLPYLRDILSPALNHVGQLWHEDKLTIAQEHMFSACVKRILLGMVNNLHSYSSNSPGILFSTPSGEPHEFGLLMCCLLAADQQYNCYYLGSNVPADDLIAAAGKLKTEIIVLSLVKCPPELATLSDVNRIIETLDLDKVGLWLGGRGAEFWQGQQESLPKNCDIISNLDMFNAKIQQRRYSD